MAFLKRVIDHLLNQVLVDSLANSRTFQRFAVWSHKTYKEMHEKSKDASGKVLDNGFSNLSEYAKQASSKLRADFEQELSKMSQAAQQKAKKS